LPFGEDTLSLLQEMRPPVVSFHFGLPEARLLARVKVRHFCI
jgi:nitronate monooxygenase